MVDSPQNKICSSGPALFTESGEDVMAFHLHRFLASWLSQHDVHAIWVTIGFEHCQVPSATFKVTTHSSEIDAADWTFDDLCQTYKHGDGLIYRENVASNQTDTLVTLPILDRPEMGGSASVLLGFVSFIAQTPTIRDAGLGSLQSHAFEAICAARRNAVRLFFDEHKGQELKPLLYNFMAHLPEWAGVDHSSMMILTSTLETMTLDSATAPQFNILAERIYESTVSSQRLVGMNVRVDGERVHVLTRAFEQQRRDTDLPYQLFVKTGEDLWESIAPSQTEPCHAIHQLDAREEESMYVLVPLVASDDSDRELLGFLCLAYKQQCPLPSSVGQLLAEISDQLSPLLRYSSLYTLSARKLWILRQLRKLTEEHIDGAGDVVSLLERASTLIQSHVEVPSVALSYIEIDALQQRHLRFVQPFGWANQDHLQLMVDVADDDRLDSGVTALAVRLKQALVLAGGHIKNDKLAFKNAIWVNESRGQLLDERCQKTGTLSVENGWVPLSHYYTSAREQAYATLAYPIMFGGCVLGAVAVEVDKSTSWFWWTGFGGHLFWQLLASELANAYYVFGVRGQVVSD